jgi:hypothetical protein
MPAEWESKELWCKHIERQLYELGALVRGQVPTVSSRLTDVLDQIDSVRKDVEKLQEALEKMRTWATNHVKKENGGTA